MHSELEASCLTFVDQSTDEDDAGLDVLQTMRAGSDELRDEGPCS